MKTLIIQSGFPRSASTLLVNALYGLIIGMQHQPIQWNDFQHSYNYDFNSPLTVFKTHETNIADLNEIFRQDFNTFFIGSERGPTLFDARYKTLKNVAIFDYEEIVKPTLCTALDGAVSDMIPYLPLSVEGCEDRVADMNARYEEIKYLPFTYTDPFYQLHGSHRSRKKLRGKRHLSRDP